jgi:hypothetical protein
MGDGPLVNPVGVVLVTLKTLMMYSLSGHQPVDPDGVGQVAAGDKNRFQHKRRGD